MSQVTFTHAGRFLAASDALQQGAPVLFGVGYDGTTSYRPGARFGPQALRAASLELETYCPQSDADLEECCFVDWGDLEIPFGSPTPVIARVEAATKAVLSAGGTPLMLGGEHSLTPGACRIVHQAHPTLVMVQLDAHADLRESYLGESYSHACAMRRCLDFLAPDALLQVGIRSGTRDEFSEMRETKRLLPPHPDALARALAPLAGRPLYLTIDLDIFDPACMPGTGTPEAGGIDWNTFFSLLQTMTDFHIVGADVVELSPPYDPSGISAALAAKVVRTLLLHMHTLAAGNKKYREQAVLR